MRFAFIAALLFTSHHALAAEHISLQMQTIGWQQPGAGSAGQNTRVILTYQNKDLPWGTRVTVVEGLRCAVGGSWSQRAERELAPAAGWTWEADFSRSTGDRYSGPCSAYEFVFKITMPDGKIIWDNGGRAPQGFYSAPIPYRGTEDGELKTIDIHALASSGEYRN